MDRNSRHTVRVAVGRCWYFVKKLSSLSACILEHQVKTPPEFRDGLEWKLERDHIEFYYRRLETDDEMSARRRVYAAGKEVTERRERAELARLLAKYQSK